MGLRADYVEGVGKLWYCATHQTLQRKPLCFTCKEQDGKGINAEAVKMKKKRAYERKEAWNKMAKRINGKLIAKYDKK